MRHVGGEEVLGLQASVVEQIAGAVAGASLGC